MIKIIRGFLKGLVFAALGVLFLLLIVPRVFGYQPYMVVSASMQQSFPVGSMIFVRAATPDEVEVGDPITFTSGTLTITHRVMEKNDAEQYFVTKGDNNSASEITRYQNLKGKALNFSIPYLGYFSSWFVTAQGKVITGIILVCTAGLSMVLGKLEDLEEEEEEEEDEKTDKNTDDIAKEGEMIEE